MWSEFDVGPSAMRPPSPTAAPRFSAGSTSAPPVPAPVNSGIASGKCREATASATNAAKAPPLPPPASAPPPTAMSLGRRIPAPFEPEWWEVLPESLQGSARAEATYGVQREESDVVPCSAAAGASSGRTAQVPIRSPDQVQSDGSVRVSIVRNVGDDISLRPERRRPHDSGPCLALPSLSAALSSSAKLPPTATVAPVAAAPEITEVTNQVQEVEATFRSGRGSQGSQDRGLRAAEPDQAERAAVFSAAAASRPVAPQPASQAPPQPTPTSPAAVQSLPLPHQSMSGSSIAHSHHGVAATGATTRLPPRYAVFAWPFEPAARSADWQQGGSSGSRSVASAGAYAQVEAPKISVPPLRSGAAPSAGPAQFSGHTAPPSARTSPAPVVAAEASAPREHSDVRQRSQAAAEDRLAAEAAALRRENAELTAQLRPAVQATQTALEQEAAALRQENAELRQQLSQLRQLRSVAPAASIERPEVPRARHRSGSPKPQHGRSSSRSATPSSARGSAAGICSGCGRMAWQSGACCGQSRPAGRAGSLPAALRPDERRSPGATWIHAPKLQSTAAAGRRERSRGERRVGQRQRDLERTRVTSRG